MSAIDFSTIATSNPVVSRIRHSTTQAITTGGWASAAMDSEDEDTYTMHDTSVSNSRITIPAGYSGRYIITAWGQFEANATGKRFIAIALNGTRIREQGPFIPDATYTTRMITTIEYPLSVGDYVEMHVYHDRGSNLNLEVNPTLYITRVGSTPSSLAAATWIIDDSAWTYATSTTFTVSGDQTTKFSKGTRIKLTQTTAKYFVVTGSSHSAGTTTVTITGGSDYTLANAIISSPNYSYLVNPPGYPSYFNYTPTFSGNATPPAIGNGTISGRFQVVGAVCTVKVSLVMGSTTTFGTGSAYTISLPIAEDTSDGLINGHGFLFDNSSSNNYNVAWRNLFFTTHAVPAGFVGTTTPFTWAQSDQIQAHMAYRF